MLTSLNMSSNQRNVDEQSEEEQDYSIHELQWTMERQLQRVQQLQGFVNTVSGNIDNMDFSDDIVWGKIVAYLLPFDDSDFAIKF